MKRGGPLKRSTPLQAKTPMKRGAGLSRTGASANGGGKAKPARAKPRVSDAVRAVVLARAKLRCERCGRDVSGGGGEVHHRRPAGAGGSKRAESHEPANLLLLCAAGHRWVESNRSEALAAGWLVSQSADPVGVPVLVCGVWVLLDPVAPTTHPVDAQRQIM